MISIKRCWMLSRDNHFIRRGLLELGRGLQPEAPPILWDEFLLMLGTPQIREGGVKQFVGGGGQVHRLPQFLREEGGVDAQVAAGMPARLREAAPHVLAVEGQERPPLREREAQVRL